MSLVKQHLYDLSPDYVPSVLEIGIDRGVMLLPLVVFLARTRNRFLAVGIDVWVQDQVKLMVQNFDLTSQQCVGLLEGNSLEKLPEIVQSQVKFDVVLIDGDHNYFTVRQELEYLDAITFPTTIVVVDDYLGRWSDRDLFYSERPEYATVKDVTPRVDTEKHGVKVAVDDWLAIHPTWQLSQPINGEPVLLKQISA